MSKRARPSSTNDGQNVRLCKIDCAGTVFTTTYRTLTAIPSMLAKMFEEDSPFGAPATTPDGDIWFDRDPEVFAWVLNYLRLEGQVTKWPPAELHAAVRAEADFFGLGPVVMQLDRVPKMKGLTCMEARRSGYFLLSEHAVAAGFNAHDLLDASYSFAEATAAGCTIAEIGAAGYLPADANIAGFTHDQIRENFAASDIVAMLRDMRPGFSCQQAMEAGYSCEAVFKAGYSAAEAKGAGFSADEAGDTGCYVEYAMGVQLYDEPTGWAWNC